MLNITINLVICRSSTYLFSMTDTQPVGFNRVALGLKRTLHPSDTRGVIFDRSFAYVIDLVILTILGFVLGFVIFIMTIFTFGLLSPLFALLTFLPLLYHSYFLSQQGATPGMNAMGVTMVSLDGSRISLGQAVIATIIFYVTVTATSLLVLLIVFLNDQRRTLHDILTGTIVVNEKIPAATIEEILD